MGKTYTIEVGNLETMAYLRAIIDSTEVEGTFWHITPKEKIQKFFPGGVEAAKNLGTKLQGRYEVWNQMGKILGREGITYSSAPWLKLRAPDRIDGNAVAYKSDGIHVGCAVVTWAEYDAMGERRKEMIEGG